MCPQNGTGDTQGWIDPMLPSLALAKWKNSALHPNKAFGATSWNCGKMLRAWGFALGSLILGDASSGWHGGKNHKAARGACYSPIHISSWGVCAPGEGKVHPCGSRLGFCSQTEESNLFPSLGETQPRRATAWFEHRQRARLQALPLSILLAAPFQHPP